MRSARSTNPTVLILLERWVKRAFDLIVSGTGLIVFAPIIVAISIAIKLDSQGPIFIRQTRYDHKSQRVQVLQFRTHGPLMTRVGQVLRRTGIDQLPQLFNVLRGEMSIVGPCLNGIGQNMFDSQILRLSRRDVKSGIIGWAQIHGYGRETETIDYIRRRIEYDIYYVENWSLLLDIKIIFMTIFAKISYAVTD